MNKSPSRAIMEIFRDNSFPIALSIAAGRFCARFRGGMVARALHAPGLQLGPGYRIIGGRFIRFGRGIPAGQKLWA